MGSTVARVLDARSTVAIASLITLALGLFFTFVWAPHPWGWQGIDQYHELARALVRGEPFGTTDVPWGYAYYGASFYWLFGERVWVPVLAQVIINTAAPLLLYRLAQPLVGARTATLAALILGIFSFNTVYASTQVSDAVCTVLFLLSLVVLARGVRTGSVVDVAIGGFLSGLVPQFRPNMVLFPAILAGGYVLIGRTWAHLGRAVVFTATVTLALTPWIVRNYRLTNTFMPTSTHGGMQLWYGSLQVGPYLESRAANPRSIFESSPLPYTSLTESPIVVRARKYECAPAGDAPALVYWTDRNPMRQRIIPSGPDGLWIAYAIPPQPAPTAVYYYLEASRRGSNGLKLTTPPGGEGNPFVLLVDDRHLEDLDRHQDLVDIFDVIRIARHLAWQEPAGGGEDLDRNGVVDASDLTAAAAMLLPDAGAGVVVFSSDASQATLRLADGSRITVPRQWRQRQTDLEVEGNLAGALVSRWRTRSSLIAALPAAPDECLPIEEVGANTVFYRTELHMMRRYMALAMDNIGRAPLAFAAASAYRMARLFIIRGSDDVHRVQQFSASRFAYAAGTILSAAYFLVFAAGAIVAVKRRSAVAYLLVPIVYVPLTICFVLTNMRYTVTMQPLMFVFVAVAVMAALRLDSPGPGE